MFSNALAYRRKCLKHWPLSEKRAERNSSSYHKYRGINYLTKDLEERIAHHQKNSFLMSYFSQQSNLS